MTDKGDMADGRDKGLSVQIFGRDYYLSTDADRDDDHIREVAALVDEKMRQIDREQGSRSAYHVAVLAGLDLVDELLRLKKELMGAQDEIASRTSRLSASLGRVLHDETAEDDDVDWLDVDGERRRGQAARGPVEDGQRAGDDGERGSKP